MSVEEIEEALRDCDYDPFADFVEDDSSVAPAVPGEEQDQHKAPKFAPVAKPGVFLAYRFEPGGKWKGDDYVADLEHFQAGVVRPSIRVRPQDPVSLPIRGSRLLHPHCHVGRGGFTAHP